MESFLFQALIYLGAAVIAVPFAARLGLGSVLGYLTAGILIGPVFGLVGSETESLQHFAEFGVVMMLFLIGLELEPRALWDMRHRLIGLGGAQVLITLALIAGATWLLGQSGREALALGMIFSLSSTAIVLQTLNEKQLMQTAGGRSSFSVLLTQDIAVIPMLALLPLLGSSQASSSAGGHGGEGAESTAGAHAERMQHIIESLPGWGITLITIGAIAAIIVAGIFGTRPVFRYIHRARLRELYTALALLIVISIAFIMTLVNLSPALGAFLAGMVLANSEFRHELESDIEPFKGLLLGLFFITVGAGISFPTLFEAPLTILGLTLLLMLVKGAVLYGLSKVFKLGRRNRWLFTLGLCQAGEFGFVLTSFSVQTGVIGSALSETALLVIAMSMLLTPLFFIVWEQINKRLSEGAESRQKPEADEIDEQAPIIIAGIGRFGQVVNRMLQLAGYSTTVLDHDLDTIQLMRKFGFKGFFGDPTRPELLHAAGLDTAKVLVVTMDEPENVVALVKYARKARPDLHIIARAYDRNNVYELYRAGADDIVREVFDSSLRAGRYVLENIGLSEFEAAELEKAFFKIDRSALREMAELWKPGVPISRNEPYMERARALNTELESALSAKYDELRGRRSGDDDDEDEDEDEDDEGARVA